MGSNPNWSTGYVPSAEEWNSLWASKIDEDAELEVSSVTTGTLLVGSGTLSALPYVFQSTTDADPSLIGGNSRKNMFQTILTYSATTTNIWEGVTSFIYVNGPGQANGEINGFHAYQEYRAGSTVLAAEGFESSVWNRGTISGYHIGYLALATNDTAATAQYFYGMKFGFVNDNPTVGSVGNYFAIDNEARSGAGSVPTNYGFIRNADPSGRISSLGALGLGDLAAPPTGAYLYVRGGDTSGSTYPVQVKNTALTNLFGIDNSGITHAYGGLVVGTGSTGGLPYDFNVALDYNPAVLVAGNRRTMFNTTLTYSTANTTNIWEGVTSYISINGPFQANGEVNNFHGNMTVAVGATSQTTNIYEAKIENRGTHTGANTNFLSLTVNYAGATASYMHGLDIQLSNANASAGSIGNYNGISFTGMSGGGSVPTNYRFIRSSDGTAPSTIMGNVTIGSLAPLGGQGTLSIYGADNSGGTFPFFVKSNTGTFNALYVDNSGVTHFANDAASIDNVGAVNSNTNFKISGVQVVSARNTGWTAFTGATNKATAYDPSTITLSQLAERVSSMQIALTTHGLLGA